MNRFAKHLQDVDCRDPDLKLDFKDEHSFEAAKKSWHWVNENAEHHFYMITDYAGCGPENERQPYSVTGVHYDEKKFVAYLTARAVEWEDIAHTYHLKVGHVPVNAYNRLARRFSGSASLSTASTFNGDWFKAEANGLTVTAGCVDCSTTGQVNFEFELDVGLKGINDASIKVSPEDVSATMELGVTTEGHMNTGWGWEKTLVSIPLQGVSLGRFVKIGGFFDVDAGVSIGNWTGTVEAGVGAKASLDNAAILEIDLLDASHSQFSGWTPSFEPIPFHVSAKVECEAKAYLQPSLKLAAEAFKKGWEVELGMRLPYVEVNVAAIADPAGVCDTTKVVGIEGGVTIGVDLVVSAATAGNGATPFWKYTLIDESRPLLDICLPFGADGAPSSTTSTTSSAYTSYLPTTYTSELPTTYTSELPTTYTSELPTRYTSELPTTYSSYVPTTLSSSYVPHTSSTPTYTPPSNLTRFAF
jgi:hypothetical protein